ncbi:DNA-processing protein DprA [Synechococcus sp. PCC 6716]|nr:DNA-processing protein DprA [Synechococcus sp. PCC 6716]
MAVPTDAAYWYSWAQVPGIGPVLLQRLRQHFGTLKAAWEAPLRDLGAVEGIGTKLLAVIEQQRSSDTPERAYAEHARQNPQHWVYGDTGYPHLLTEIPDPPPLLYYGGTLGASVFTSAQGAIAIVGTRDPSEYGRRWARKLGYCLGQAGFVVASGMAAGIDAEAHWGCLESGGSTIAVLATGVDMIYPPENQALYWQLVQRGALLSEYPRGTSPDRAQFPRRNRIIAGLCRAVIIVEAPFKSGALITARYAAEYGRDVYVLPGHLDNHRSKGGLSLVNQGAHIILGEEALLQQLGQTPPLQLPSPPAVPQLTPQQQQILQTLSHLSVQGHTGSIAFDDIVQAVPLDTGTVAAELLTLELLGVVQQEPGNRYLLP